MCLFYFKNKADALYWGKHEGDGKALTPGQSMISGYTAAFFGPLASGPMDVVKTRLQAQGKKVEGGGGAANGQTHYRGFFHALTSIVREEIAGMIASGDLAAGDRVNESELATRLGLSLIHI